MRALYLALAALYAFATVGAAYLMHRRTPGYGTANVLAMAATAAALVTAAER